MGRHPTPPPPATRQEVTRLSQYLKDLRRRGLSPATLAAYETYWAAIGRWYATSTGRPFDAASLDARLLQRYRAALVASHPRGTAKAWLRWLDSYLAATVGLAEDQRAALTLSLQRPKPAADKLLAGAARMLAAVRPGPERRLLDLCLYGGLTVREALALRWRHVDAENSVIRLKRRRVPMHPALARGLRTRGPASQTVVGFSSQRDAALALKAAAGAGRERLLPREFRAAFVAAYRVANEGEPLITRALHCITGSSRLLNGALPQALPEDYLARTLGRIKYPR